MIQSFLKLITPLAKKAWNYRGLILGTIAVVLFWLLITRPDPPITSNERILRDSLRIEKAKNGNRIAVISQRLIDKDNEAEAIKKERDSIADLLKIKPKYIKGITTTTNTIDTFFVEKVVTLTPPEGDEDSLVLSTEHHDHWIDIKAIMSRTQGLIQVKIRDTPYVVVSERRPLFKKPVNEVRVYHSNPYIMEGTGYSYAFKSKKLVATIGPTIGYDLFNKKIFTGLSVQWPIIKIYR